MRVLKAGTLKCKKVAKGECPDCGCEFEVTREELEKEVADNFFNPPNWFYNCPTEHCGKKVYFLPEQFNA